MLTQASILASTPANAQTHTHGRLKAATHHPMRFQKMVTHFPEVRLRGQALLMQCHTTVHTTFPLLPLTPLPCSPRAMRYFPRCQQQLATQSTQVTMLDTGEACNNVLTAPQPLIILQHGRAVEGGHSTVTVVSPGWMLRVKRGWSTFVPPWTRAWRTV